MTTAVILRPLAEADIAAVAAIHVAAFRAQGVEDIARCEASLREDLVRPWARVCVATAEGTIVGAFVAWVVADEVHVHDVATHPDRRRQGIGRALVAEVVALARREHALHVHLEVRRSNVAALELYRGAGFAVVGVRERYYDDGEDALEMTLRFDPATGAVVHAGDEVVVA